MPVKTSSFPFISNFINIVLSPLLLVLTAVEPVIRYKSLHVSAKQKQFLSIVTDCRKLFQKLGLYNKRFYCLITSRFIGHTHTQILYAALHFC